MNELEGKHASPFWNKKLVGLMSSALTQTSAFVYELNKC